MPKLFKFLFAIFLSTLYILNYPSPASAQAPTPFPIASSIPQTLTPLPSYIPPTSPIYTDLFVYNLFHSFSCLAIGQSTIGQPCVTYQVTKNAQGMIQSVPMLSSVNTSGGTIGAVAGLIGAMYKNPPVKTADYLAFVGKELGLVKEAQAQVTGSGAAVLNPVLGLWQVSRNISYVVLTIIFIIIGLMVMFRTKINPQTVITAQAAIPGLIVGLILITFSYFLAGLVSDTAFIGTNIVGYYFQVAQNKPPQNLVSEIQNQNILSVFAPFTRIVSFNAIVGIINPIWDELADPTSAWYEQDPQKVIRNLAMFAVMQVIMPFGSLIGGIGQIAMGAISLGAVTLGPVQVVAVALQFVAILALLYTLLRLLLRLISTYLTVVVLTFTAPFQLLAAALPGRQGIATGWILSMLGNVLVFPAVLGVLYFAAFILGPQFVRDKCIDPCPFIITDSNTTKNDSILNSPVYAADGTITVPGSTIIGSNTFPLFGGMNIDFLRLILAFGALLALPAIPDIIIKSIGKASQAGQLLGQEIGSGVGQGQKYAGQFQQGISGSVGQVGRLTNEPGYFGEPVINPNTNKPTGEIIWTKSYDPRYGARIGTLSKVGQSSIWQGTVGKVFRKRP